MQKSDYRICFVVPSLSSGGAERVVSVLSSELAEQGYPIEVIVYFRNDEEYPISDKVKLVCLSGGNEQNYKKIGFKEKIRKLRNIIKDFEPEYIIPFLPHVGVHVALATLGMKKKIIQTIRNAPEFSPPSKLQRIMRNFLVRCSYKTLAQTEEQKAYFPKSVQNKIFILPNPIFGGFFNEERIKHNRIRKVVSIGRLTEQKNFPLVIDAVVALRGKFPDIELDIYGEGELRESLEKYIRESKGEEFCRLKGRSNDILTVYKQSDVFVLSSDFEGMPNSLMEAMAAGVPCISTDCETGPRDLIKSGENGILTPIRSKEKMIEALEWMLNNPEEASNMGIKARETVEKKYGAKTIAKKLLENI